jgi:hypothetical protein
MNLARLRKWEGPLSLLWVGASFGVAELVHSFGSSSADPFVPNIPAWATLATYLLLLVTCGFGLLLAICGIKEGPVHNRICAGISICAIAYLVWAAFLYRVPSRGALNKPDAATPAMVSCLAIEDQWRRAADLEC